MQYSITFCSRPEVAIDVISGRLSSLHKAVKIGYPGLHRSLYIQPKVIKDGILCPCRCSFQLKVATDLVSSVAVDELGWMSVWNLVVLGQTLIVMDKEIQAA